MLCLLCFEILLINGYQTTVPPTRSTWPTRYQTYQHEGCQAPCIKDRVSTSIALLFYKTFTFVRYPLTRDRLVGLVVKASAEGPGFESGRSRVRIPLAPGFFRGRVIPVTSKLALQWLSCQAPGVIGSVLGLVGPVSVYCDWVRWKV